MIKQLLSYLLVLSLFIGGLPSNYDFNKAPSLLNDKANNHISMAKNAAKNTDDTNVYSNKISAEVASATSLLNSDLITLKLGSDESAIDEIKPLDGYYTHQWENYRMDLIVSQDSKQLKNVTLQIKFPKEYIEHKDENPSEYNKGAFNFDYFVKVSEILPSSGSEYELETIEEDDFLIANYNFKRLVPGENLSLPFKMRTKVKTPDGYSNTITANFIDNNTITPIVLKTKNINVNYHKFDYKLSIDNVDREKIGYSHKPFANISSNNPDELYWIDWRIGIDYYIPSGTTVLKNGIETTLKDDYSANIFAAYSKVGLEVFKEISLTATPGEKIIISKSIQTSSSLYTDNVNPTAKYDEANNKVIFNAKNDDGFLLLDSGYTSSDEFLYLLIKYPNYDTTKDNLNFDVEANFTIINDKIETRNISNERRAYVEYREPNTILWSSEFYNDSFYTYRANNVLDEEIKLFKLEVTNRSNTYPGNDEEVNKTLLLKNLIIDESNFPYDIFNITRLVITANDNFIYEENHKIVGPAKIHFYDENGNEVSTPVDLNFGLEDDEFEIEFPKEAKTFKFIAGDNFYMNNGHRNFVQINVFGKAVNKQALLDCDEEYIIVRNNMKVKADYYQNDKFMGHTKKVTGDLRKFTEGLGDAEEFSEVKSDFYLYKYKTSIGVKTNAESRPYNPEYVNNIVKISAAINIQTVIDKGDTINLKELVNLLPEGLEYFEDDTHKPYIYNSIEYISPRKPELPYNATESQKEDYLKELDYYNSFHESFDSILNIFQNMKPLYLVDPSNPESEPIDTHKNTATPRLVENFHGSDRQAVIFDLNLINGWDITKFEYQGNRIVNEDDDVQIYFYAKVIDPLTSVEQTKTYLNAGEYDGYGTTLETYESENEHQMYKDNHPDIYDIDADSNTSEYLAFAQDNVYLRLPGIYRLKKSIKGSEDVAFISNPYEGRTEIMDESQYRLQIIMNDLPSIQAKKIKLIDILPYKGDENGSEFDTFLAGEIKFSGINDEGHSFENLPDGFSVFYSTNRPTNNDLEAFYDDAANWTNVPPKNIEEVKTIKIEYSIEGIEQLFLPDGNYNFDIPIISKAEEKTLLENKTLKAINIAYTAKNDEKFGESSPTQLNMLSYLVSGIVFTDVNNNGIFDADEFLLPGKTIALYDEDGNELLNANGEHIKTTSDTNGKYELLVIHKDKIKIKATKNDEESFSDVQNPLGILNGNNVDKNGESIFFNIDANKDEQTLNIGYKPVYKELSLHSNLYDADGKVINEPIDVTYILKIDGENYNGEVQVIIDGVSKVVNVVDGVLKTTSNTVINIDNVFKGSSYEIKQEVPKGYEIKSTDIISGKLDDNEDVEFNIYKHLEGKLNVGLFLKDKKGNIIKDFDNFKVLISGPQYEKELELSLNNNETVRLDIGISGKYSVKVVDDLGYIITVDKDVVINATNPNGTIIINGIVADAIELPKTGNDNYFINLAGLLLLIFGTILITINDKKSIRNNY